MSVVLLISGRGSNMQAILDAGIPVAAVLSNRADAAGIALAACRGGQQEPAPPHAAGLVIASGRTQRS